MHACGRTICFLCESNPDYWELMWDHWRSELAMHHVDWDPTIVF